MSFAGRPIKPSEVAEAKAKHHIPPEVFDAFNAAIIAHWDGTYSEFPQTEVVNTIVAKMAARDESINPNRQYYCDMIDRNHWLDVEAIYAAEGWRVDYEKPDYGDGGSAMFTFARKRRGG